MIEIKNRGRSPVQILVRSGKTPKGFTTLNIPGIGKGKNIVVIEDEMNTETIKKIEKLGMITTRYIK